MVEILLIFVACTKSTGVIYVCYRFFGCIAHIGGRQFSYMVPCSDWHDVYQIEIVVELCVIIV